MCTTTGALGEARRGGLPGPGRTGAVLVTVEAFDWNCPQHMALRFTQAELAEVLAPVRQEMDALRAAACRSAAGWIARAA
jgi:hypothetical protein